MHLTTAPVLCKRIQKSRNHSLLGAFATIKCTNLTTLVCGEEGQGETHLAGTVAMIFFFLVQKNKKLVTFLQTVYERHCSDQYCVFPKVIYEVQ